MGLDETPTPWLNSDELDVVQEFLKASVRFVIIGGRAVQFHGHARPAKDLDVFVEFSAKNWQSLKTALKPLNAGLPPFEDVFPREKYQFKLRFYPTVELLTHINGVCFAMAWKESIETAFQGFRFHVISKSHLIVSKRNSCRSIDLTDIEGLQSTSS